MEKTETPYWHQKLSGRIDPEILNLSIDLSNKNMWDAVHPMTIDYLFRNCLDYPWANHLAFIAVAKTSYGDFTPSSVKQIIKALHARFKMLFPALNISSMEEWNTNTHMHSYIMKEVLPEHSDSQRYHFLNRYEPASNMINRFFSNKLNEAKKEKLKKYLIPRVNDNFFDNLGRKVISQQKTNRKKETDAIVPYYAQLRGEAHFRWNQVSRLRNKYREVLAAIENDITLPIPFHYQESNGNIYHFRLWDRRSFVIAHKEQYSQKTFKNAKQKYRAYSEDINEYFLEYVKTTDTNENVVEEIPFWFLELLKKGMFGSAPESLTGQERVKINNYFLTYGYGDADKGESFRSPFRSNDIGMFNLGAFMIHAQKVAIGTILNIESLYEISTFALAALEIFTTTGARMNELTQISATKECMVILREEAHPQSKETKPIKRRLLRLVPKGRTEPENFFIGEETARCLNHIVLLLREIYNETTIPDVLYAGERAPLFNPKPYLFQYNRKHLSANTITTCLRFLLHGMYLKTQEGKPVLIKAHLLRHAFATHAVQVEKIPIDIVREWMHQRNVEVTEYYSAPTSSQLAMSADIWLTSIATHIHVGHAIKRSPVEIQSLYNDAKGKVGALTNVVGGLC
jgi:site-specific recombinase XerC